ncbi:transglycosylase SLT domain-containing protein [Nocardioidaceae bacterium]|nr:transglycosylase SLT domain-containing protein [Nocardioidaceae bacterium]
MTFGGLAAVQARISEIQAQFPAPAPVVSLPAARTGGTASGAAPAPNFAGALADASSLLRSAIPVQQAGGLDRAGSAGGPTGSDVVAGARKYLGVPYVWGGTDPSVGLDCSGLVQRVYRDLGIELPRVSRDQAQAGRPVALLADARPGDLLAFNSPVSHIAIYIGGNQMIEAPRPGKDVQVSPVYDTPTAIRRVLPEASVTGAGALARAGAVGGSNLTGVPYADLFTSAGRRHGVPPVLLAEVARAESAFDPRAVSHAGAQGLMQLMPATAAGLGVSNSFDPSQAVNGAAKLLRDLLDRFGRTDLALAAYNAGPGAVLRYDGIPPYAETQAYVSKIMGRLEVAA